VGYLECMSVMNIMQEVSGSSPLPTKLLILLDLTRCPQWISVITLKCTTQAYLASGQLMPLPSQSHAEQNLKKPLKTSNPRPNLSLGTVDRLLAFYCTRVTTG
jgi:hypothetical protein